MSTLTKKSAKELRNLAIASVQFYSTLIIGFTLTDGQSIRAGTKYNFDQSHTFDRAIKITKIETIFWKDEWEILRINFYSGTQTLAKVGSSTDNFVKDNAGRIETFEIATDEQLIGCELDHGTNHIGEGDYFKGVTWFKWKIMK